MLSLVGYDLKKTESTRLKMFTIVNLIFLTAIIFPETKYVTDNISDVQLASDGLCPLLCGASCLAKLITIRFNKKYFYKLIWSLQYKWNKGFYFNIFL